MNERLIELAKQCGYWSGQTIEMNDVGIQKFALLIVQECANWLETTVVECELAGDLLQHFGVGE